MLNLMNTIDARPVAALEFRGMPCATTRSQATATFLDVCIVFMWAGSQA